MHWFQILLKYYKNFQFGPKFKKFRDALERNGMNQLKIFEPSITKETQKNSHFFKILKLFTFLNLNDYSCSSVQDCNAINVICQKYKICAHFNFRKMEVFASL